MGSMLGLERQRLLLQHLRARGSGNVVDLASALGVSPSTVRRDLRDMNDRGLVTRVHGGASVADAEIEAVLAARAAQHSDQKRRIGAAAAVQVPDGATVLITGGTTTEAMLPHLAGREGLTVLTNGLNIALGLSRCPGISTVVLGGVLRHGELSLLGPLTEQALAEFHVDVAYCSAFGIHPSAGLTGADVREAGTDRRLLQGAEHLVVLADASKIGRRGPVRLAGTTRIDRLITDDTAPPEQLEALRSAGVEVQVC
jgi:DeoR/GlpR family transcriptional regulator of sugar metabolism